MIDSEHAISEETRFTDESDLGPPATTEVVHRLRFYAPPVDARGKPITFSIVIPCPPDREVPKAVESALKIDYPPELFEVIVVRGNNPSMQRNQGVSLASGDIIAFTDDDCDIPEEWLRVAAERFRDDDIAIIGGPNLTPSSDPPLAKTFGLVCSSPLATASMSRRYRRAKAESNVDETALVLSNLFCRKELFEKGLSFSPLLFPNEENHFMNGATRLGHSMEYVPDLYVYHPRKRTWTGFVRQFMGYGTGRGKQTVMDPRSVRPIHLAPAAFSLTVILLPLILLAFRWSVPILPALSLVYLGVITVESLRLLRSYGGLGPLPSLLASFFVLHFAYGIGMILGFFSGKGKVNGRQPTHEDVTFFYPA